MSSQKFTEARLEQAIIRKLESFSASDLYKELLEHLDTELDPAYLARREINQLLPKYCR